MAQSAAASTYETRFALSGSELAELRKVLHDATGDCAALAYPLEKGLIAHNENTRALVRELKSVSRQWPNYMSANSLLALRSRVRTVLGRLQELLEQNPANTEDDVRWNETMRETTVPCFWFNEVRGKVSSTWIFGLLRFEKRQHVYQVRPSESFVRSVLTSLK